MFSFKKNNFLLPIYDTLTFYDNIIFTNLSKLFNFFSTNILSKIILNFNKNIVFDDFSYCRDICFYYVDR